MKVYTLEYVFEPDDNELVAVKATLQEVMDYAERGSVGDWDWHHSDYAGSNSTWESGNYLITEWEV